MPPLRIQVRHQPGRTTREPNGGRTNLALHLVLLAPGSHDEGIVDCITNRSVDLTMMLPLVPSTSRQGCDTCLAMHVCITLDKAYARQDEADAIVYEKLKKCAP